MLPKNNKIILLKIYICSTLNRTNKIHYKFILIHLNKLTFPVALAASLSSVLLDFSNFYKLIFNINLM